ncbi:MAG: hypothetical protein ACOC1X_02690 [Promethearchaeota archaeon]
MIGITDSYLDWEKKHQPNKDELDKYKRNSLGISNQAFKEFLKQWKKKNLKAGTDPSGTNKHSKDKVIGRGVVPPPDGDTREEGK